MKDIYLLHPMEKKVLQFMHTLDMKGMNLCIIAQNYWLCGIGHYIQITILSDKEKLQWIYCKDCVMRILTFMTQSF